MKTTHLPVWISISSASLLCGSLLQYGISDAMAGYDIGLITIMIVASIGSIVGMRMRGDYTLPAGLAELQISSVMLAMAGCAMVISVSVRQWVQMSLPEEIEAAVLINAGTRLRYAFVLNVSYLWGWAFLLWAVRPRTPLITWWNTHNREAIPVVGLMVLAAGMRLLWLEDYPNIINGDEGLIGWWARTMFTEAGPLAYTLTAMDGVGTFYLTILRGLIDVFGSQIWVLRVMPAMAGSASIGSIYLLARQLYGKRIGLLSAVLLTFAHTHIHFSRQIAVSYIYAAFFLPIVLWALWQLIATRRAWPAVVAGFMLAMHANFYVDAWAWAVLTVLVLVAWLVVDRAAIIGAAPAIGVYIGVAVLGFGPQLVWAAVLPEEFFSRLTTDGSFVSGWIYREAAISNVSVVQYVLYLYQMAFEAILTSPFLDFYHADVPILDVLSAVFFGVGTVIVHNRLHTRRGMLVLGWFWGGITALAVCTLPISTYHYRLFVIVPVLMLQIAIGLEWVWTQLERWLPARVAVVIVSMVVILIAGVNVHVYVTRLAQVCRYGGDPQTQRAGAAARFVRAQNIRDAEVVIVGELNNVHAGTWKSFEYLNESLHFSNSFPDQPYDFRPFRGKDIYFLYIPERFLERENIQRELVEVQVYEPITMCGEVFGYLTHVRVP